MEPVPVPHVLDPDRILDNDRGNFRPDHEARAAMYEKGFRETSDYAQQLWDALAAARQYLWDSLPSDPRSPGPHPHTSASPTGPDDDEGWQHWIDAYAGVTSVLCGPHGDNGFGGTEAREAARFRRDVPDPTLALSPEGARSDVEHEMPYGFSPSSVPQHDHGEAGRHGDAPRPPAPRRRADAVRTGALMAAAATLGGWLGRRRTARSTPGR